MKKIFLCLLLIILLMTGCKKTKVIEKTEMSIDCNGEKSKIEVKSGARFNCTLIGDNYNFEIRKAGPNRIMIRANKSGLSKQTNKTINLLRKENKWYLEKDNELKLVTQSMDYNEELTLTWR